LHAYRERQTDRQAGKQADSTELREAFRNFSNAPKIMVKVDVKDKLTANHVTGDTQGEQKYNSTR
jgi:hypothetical protein